MFIAILLLSADSSVVTDFERGALEVIGEHLHPQSAALLGVCSDMTMVSALEP